MQYSEKESTSIKATEKTAFSQSDVINFHILRWREAHGKEYQHIYNETSEYFSFIDTDNLGPEEVLKEVLKLYKKSLIKGDNNVVIDKILDSMITELSCIKILKEGDKRKDFLCRLESFFDNINYAVE